MSRLCAYALATAVHLVLLAWLAAGVGALVAGFGDVVAMVLGAIVIGLVVFFRPRLGRVPRAGVVDRAELPALAAHVDAVAAALDVAPPHVLVVSDEFNAGWWIAGLRRRRVLELGLPLLTALGPAERTALIAHELAHARHRDTRRGLWVGSAVDALADAHAVLAPEPRLADGTARQHADIQDTLTHGLLALLAVPVGWALRLLALLLLGDSRRAEYLADDRAAAIAGTRAVISLSVSESCAVDQELERLGPFVGRRIAERFTSELYTGA